jgi:hypothetical protein
MKTKIDKKLHRGLGGAGDLSQGFLMKGHYWEPKETKNRRIG